MKLSFYTPPQGMAFADPAHHLANAWQLKAGVIYDVFGVVRNGDPVEYHNVQINVTHNAFGIGLPGGTSFIVQPDPIDVPPALNPNQPGLASFQFQFIAPPAGHGCLTAKIVMNNVTVNQNLTVLSAPQGIRSTISFLVFGDPSIDQTMVLTVQQKLENGTLVTPAEHWPHQFVSPSLTLLNQTSDSVTVVIPRDTYHSVGLKVAIPPTANASHIFFVRGLVNNADQGSVSLLVKPDPTFVKPDPYVIGGYESADIVLVDAAGNEVPLFGNPASDTILAANTYYTLKAIVHNGSKTPAPNTVVRFWQSHGGISAESKFLDVQTVTVPGNGSIEVTSGAPFHSGEAFSMSCAIVTVYNAQSDLCNKDYPTLSDAFGTGALMDPNHYRDKHSPAAWRNTHSRIAFIGQRFNIELATAYPRIPLPAPLPPVELSVESVLVPHAWQTMPEAMDAMQTLQAAGAQARFPAFLLPTLRNKFKNVDLDIEVAAENIRVETLELITAATANVAGIATAMPPVPIRKFNLHATADKPLPLAITGSLPRDAHDGDIILVRCSATYPSSDGTPGAQVSFTEALHVMQR